MCKCTENQVDTSCRTGTLLGTQVEIALNSLVVVRSHLRLSQLPQAEVAYQNAKQNYMKHVRESGK